MSFLHSQGPPGPPGPSFDVVNILFGYQKILFFCMTVIYSFVLFHLFTKYALHVYNVLTFCCRNL